MSFDNIVRVYDKRMNLLAVFDDKTEGLSEDAKRNLIVAPTVSLRQNGESTLTFQMLANSEKWSQIKDPENIYILNDRVYSALSDNAYQYEGEESVRIVNVTLVENWYLLDRQYNQAYNCGIYVYAKARYSHSTPEGAVFTINASDCSNPSNTISSQNAWEQVKTWEQNDANGNRQSYAILTSDEFKPTNWTDFPSGVFLKSLSVSGNTATITIQARAGTRNTKTFPYSGSNTYKIDVSPVPTSVDGVTVNFTTVDEGSYATNEKTVPYTYNSSTGVVTLNYTPATNEKVNGIVIIYTHGDLGQISPGATCTFAFGAEAIDEHTFVILPKANAKYKLTIDGVAYDDSQVKDSRGVVMPRGSGGYAMWAALKNSGWTLGICDIIATDFDASIDYGCFNIESDMKDVLYNVQYIQELYGGILDWDSLHKVLNYRAENSTDYQAYDDGFNRWTGMEFREGKNMTEVPVITVDNNLITKGYLLGYGNLNVKKVNGGKTYIEDHSFTDATYEGYLSQPLIYDTRDEGGQKQLLYWGQKELAKKCKPRKTIELTVTDLRTSEGYEHETFFVNDIVRVYYRDSDGGTQHMEEKRIVFWEYNAFAMWDCTVELGDKTQNLAEIFKLIYNNSNKLPGSNASGNISSSKVDMGYGWGDDMYYGDENSLQHYIELIARTTTENSDAIAGLILDTNELYASADLFAYYQKQTDTLFSESYAAFHAYADEKSAEALMEANHYSEKVSEDLHGNIKEEIVESAASVRAYADDKKAEAIQQATYTSQQYVNGQLVNYTTTTALNSAIATQNQAISQMEARLENKLTGYATTASLTAVANQQSAMTQQMSRIENELTGKANMASVTTYVDQAIARIDITAQVNQAIYPITSNINVGSEGVSIRSAGFYVQSGTVSIGGGGQIQLNGSVSINGSTLGFSSAWVSLANGGSTTLQYVTWR